MGEARAAAVEAAPAEEAAAEEPAAAEEAAEVAVEEAAPEEASVEDAAEEPAPVDAIAEEEEDGPLEDWTRKELAGECKTLGLSDKGVKAVLIARIKEARASPEPVVEETPVEEAAE